MEFATEISDLASLDQHLAEAGPAFVWDAGTNRVVWCNAAAEALWQSTSDNGDQEIAFDQAMPAMQHLKRLSTALAPGASSQQTLTFWWSGRVGEVRCCCTRLQSARGDAAMLVAMQAEPVAAEHNSELINGHTAVAVESQQPPALAPEDAATLAEIARMIRSGSTGTERAQPLAVSAAADQSPTPQQTQFLAELAHELRTPLNAIIGFGELLQSEQFGPLGSAHYARYTDNILVSARHCLALTNDLFDLTGLASGAKPMEFSDVDIAAVAEACLDLLEPVAQASGIQLESEFAPDLPHAVLDRRSVMQILLNLATNAIKFSPRNTVVTLRANYRIGTGIDVSVTDAGPGMGASNGTGSGLGLPLSRALAEANGGHLVIERGVDEGTVATLHLPMSRLLI